jgi:CheY-like chemotaxis protein
VTAASEGADRGSEFVIELPGTSLEIEAPARASGPASQPLGLKVLVVDDNQVAAEMFGMLLPAYGCEVRVAFDGPSALALEDFDPDVALLDIGLPGMDGYELASRLRERLHEIHCIAISGYGHESDVRRSQQAGFDAYLVKPVGAATLVATLRAIANASHG